MPEPIDVQVNSLIINPAYKIALIGLDGADWKVSVASGEVRAKNTILMSSNAIGGATFYAVDSCFDGGNNTGWIFLTAPVLVTDAATLVSTQDCLAHGEIVSIGGSTTASRRGFCYVEGTGTPTVANTVVYEDGAFAAGEYSLGLAGLTQGTIYTIRAYAIIAGDVTYGASVEIRTIPDYPLNLTLLSSEKQVTVSWDNVDHADFYTLYYGTIPGLISTSSRFAGCVSPFVHPSLTPGRNYYYRVSANTNGVESALSPEQFTTVLGDITLPYFSPQNYEDTEYYVKLLTSQYQLAENFKDWLRHHIDMSKDTMECANDMNNQFDIDFALGVQLDMIGQIVGINRVLPFQPSDGSDPRLDDDTYRMLIKATIARNHWDGQLYSIEQQWLTIFPNTSIVVIDNQDMTLTVSVSGDISELLQDMIENDLIITRPQGVAINYTWAITAKKKFCYDMSTMGYGGYNEAAWVAGS